MTIILAVLEDASFISMKLHFVKIGILKKNKISRLHDVSRDQTLKAKMTGQPSVWFRSLEPIPFSRIETHRLQCGFRSAFSELKVHPRDGFVEGRTIEVFCKGIGRVFRPQHLDQFEPLFPESFLNPQVRRAEVSYLAQATALGDTDGGSSV